jgi:16S rRNA (cytosine967-C5)-methyltransferase
LPHIPTYAVVHATIEALKLVGGRRTPIGLVNAVLRDVERNRDRVLATLASRPLAIRASHPDDLVERWTARYGAERAEALCDWNNQPADVTVLTLPQGPDAAALLARLRDAGLVADVHPQCPDGLVLGHGVRVEELPGFAEGDFAVQDPATLDAVRLLDVRPGQRVLDACASPGGKAARIARMLAGQGRLVALERHADRLQSLHETLERLAHGTPFEIRQADATEATVRELGGPFDRILLDVPCSNSGVLRRRPDARWRLDPERTRRLTGLQAHLLEHAATLLAPGGKIVYSTCSIDAVENEEQIDRFRHRHPEFLLEATAAHIPPGTDGAFAAVLAKS